MDEIYDDATHQWLPFKDDLRSEYVGRVFRSTPVPGGLQVPARLKESTAHATWEPAWELADAKSQKAAATTSPTSLAGR